MKPSTNSVPLRMLVAALVTGAFFASLSLIVSSLAVRVIVGTVSGTLPMALIVAGTLAGAWAGGWYSQPVVTQLVDTVVEASKSRRGR